MDREGRHILLFLDSGPRYLDQLIDRFLIVKIAFLAKNTTSRKQLLDAELSNLGKCKTKKLAIALFWRKIDVIKSVKPYKGANKAGMKLIVGYCQ